MEWRADSNRRKRHFVRKTKNWGSARGISGAFRPWERGIGPLDEATRTP